MKIQASEQNSKESIKGVNKVQTDLLKANVGVSIVSKLNTIATQSNHSGEISG
jgi:hypothetical protein